MAIFKGFEHGAFQRCGWRGNVIITYKGKCSRILVNIWFIYLAFYIRLLGFTFAGRCGFIPLSFPRTLNGRGSMQFKTCFTVEAACGARLQLGQRVAALAD